MILYYPLPSGYIGTSDEIPLPRIGSYNRDALLVVLKEMVGGFGGFMDSWATAGLTLISVVVGAALQHLLSRRTTDATHFLQLRTNAYIDFIKGVAAVAAAQ